MSLGCQIMPYLLWRPTVQIMFKIRSAHFVFKINMLWADDISHISFHRDGSIDIRASSGDLSRLSSNADSLGPTASQDIRKDDSKQELLGDGPCYQTGVLRTNCMDCLDRTNVAQYAYGLAALGRQLHAMGATNVSKIYPDSSIASALMDLYQSMGDALAHQYGGSAAHNTVNNFCLLFFSYFVNIKRISESFIMVIRPL